PWFCSGRSVTSRRRSVRAAGKYLGTKTTAPHKSNAWNGRRADVRGGAGVHLVIKSDLPRHGNRHRQTEGYRFVSGRALIGIALNDEGDRHVRGHNRRVFAAKAARKDGSPIALVFVRLPTMSRDSQRIQLRGLEYLEPATAIALAAR